MEVKASNNINFRRTSSMNTELHGTPYDFTSIMHYFFSRDMKPRTYAPRWTGFAKTLSKYDKIAVERHYGCIWNGKIVKKKRIVAKVSCNGPRQVGVWSPKNDFGKTPGKWKVEGMKKSKKWKTPGMWKINTKEKRMKWNNDPKSHGDGQWKINTKEKRMKWNNFRQNRRNWVKKFVLNKEFKSF